MSFAQQMSGINIVNIYAQKIFDEVATDSGSSVGNLSSKQETYFIGMGGLAGAFIGIYTVK